MLAEPATHPSPGDNYPGHIRFLLALPGVDRDEVRGYFERHDLMERYDELEATP